MKLLEEITNIKQTELNDNKNEKNSENQLNEHNLFYYQNLLNSIISINISSNCMKENEDYSFLLDKIQLFQKIENKKEEEKKEEEKENEKEKEIKYLY